jgi:ABC-type transport system involved in multi-copper enzyme maturation permease subunit
VEPSSSYLLFEDTKKRGLEMTNTKKIFLATIVMGLILGLSIIIGCFFVSTGEGSALESGGFFIQYGTYSAIGLMIIYITASIIQCLSAVVRVGISICERLIEILTKK